MKNMTTLAAALTAVALTTSAFAQQESQPATGAAVGTDASATGMSASQPGTAAGSMAATTGQATELSSSEKEFIKEVAQRRTAEDQHAQLAQQKAQNPQVKQLALRILQDNQQSNQRLMQIAQLANIQPQTELKGDHKDLQEKLQKADAVEFDKHFAKEMVKQHKTDIKKFEEIAKDAKNPQVKSFAEQALPKLREQLQMAQTAAGEKSDTGFSPTANYQINQQPGTAGQPGTSTNHPGSTNANTNPSGTGTGTSTSPNM